MTFPRVAVAGVGLWLPAFPNSAAWLAGTPDPEATKPNGVSLGRVNRRRASQLGRALADAAAEAVAMAGVDKATVPVVVGSSIGEAATMIGLLDQMWRTNEPLSPADFTVSVHNAASGLISIANQNRGMTTSLAADEDTPAAALMEAIGYVLVHDVPVLVACGDEPAPENLAGQAPPWAMLAAAVVLAPIGRAGALAELTVHPNGAGEAPPPGFAEPTRANPQIGLGFVVDAVLRRRRGRLALDTGRGRGHTAELFDPQR